MHDAKVVLKDGTIKCGPVWTWKPTEGWFELAGEDYGIIYFKDVVSAIVRDQRVGPEILADVDLLEKARKEGWNEYD